MKKRGENVYFPPIVKKFSYFFPNWFEIYKTAKKRLKNFACCAHTLIIIYFIWGKKLNPRRGGGGDKNFKFNKHPSPFHSAQFLVWPTFIDFCIAEEEAPAGRTLQRTLYVRQALPLRRLVVEGNFGWRGLRVFLKEVVSLKRYAIMRNRKYISALWGGKCIYWLATLLNAALH